MAFGNASLLSIAQEYGFRAVGVDLRRENVQVLNKLGIEAHCDYLQNIQLDKACAVISFMDVLEHIPFPGDALSAAHEKLAKGGVVFVSMPNSDSIVWKFLNTANANPYWGEIEHYHNFGRERLYAYLEELGFRPVRYGISERYSVCMEVVALKV